MRISGRAVFSLVLAAVAAFAVVSALAWPLKAALFPLVMGIPLCLLALAQLVLDLRGAGRGAAGGPPMDLEPSAGVPPEIARRRTLAVFGWMAGFILLVLFVGFPAAVPLFVFAYLRFQSAAGWGLALVLTAAAWGFFYVLFERVLRFPFEAGLVQTWLGL